MRTAFRHLTPAALGLIGALAVGVAMLVPARAVTTTVHIAGFAFSPDDVTITAGDSITWVNDDPAVHTATSSTGAFDSGGLVQGASYTVTFTTPGDYAYLCTPHPVMTGTVHVVAAASTPAAGGGEIPNVAMSAVRAKPIAALGLVLLATALLIAARALRRPR